MNTSICSSCASLIFLGQAIETKTVKKYRLIQNHKEIQWKNKIFKRFSLGNCHYQKLITGHILQLLQSHHSSVMQHACDLSAQARSAPHVHLHLEKLKLFCTQFSEVSYNYTTPLQRTSLFMYCCGKIRYLYYHNKSSKTRSIVLKIKKPASTIFI